MDGSGAPGEERLRASRARLLAAADAERREIERALHDGVQQELVALGVNLQLARTLRESEPPDADALLEEMRGDVRRALDGLRALANRIYPSLLPSRGLAEALRAAAGAAGVSIRIDPPEPRRHAAETEAALYFCGRDALELAGPGGSIRIGDQDGVFSVEVVARDASQEARVTHLRDRVDALGGTLTCEARTGSGARVAVEIPLYDASSAR